MLDDTGLNVLTVIFRLGQFGKLQCLNDMSLSLTGIDYQAKSSSKNFSPWPQAQLRYRPLYPYESVFYEGCTY